MSSIYPPSVVLNTLRPFVVAKSFWSVTGGPFLFLNHVKLLSRNLPSTGRPLSRQVTIAEVHDLKLVFDSVF